MRAPASVLLGLLVAACSSGPDATSGDEAPVVTPPAEPTNPGAPPAAPAKFQTVACRFLVPKTIEGQTFHCADLTVTENRRNPSKTITLHVGIIHGKAGPGAVPTVELIGGPGGSSEDLVGGVAAKVPDLMAVYGKFLDKGDLVLLDQRGTGRSIPRLSCGQDEETEACAKRLQAAGADLAAYDTIENADDVHDLKEALGAPKIDLHGISYGTRLALEIVKRHPDDVRAAIVDGVMPPDVSVMGGFQLSMDAVLTKVFTQCAADAACNAKYPDLDGTVTKLKAKLDATPFKVKDIGYRGYGQSSPYAWSDLVNELIELSYEEGTAARIPYKLHRMLDESQTDFDADRAAEDKAMEQRYEDMAKADASNPLAEELHAALDKATDEDMAAADSANGMYLSVTCNDYGQHETLDASMAALQKARPEFRDQAEVTDEFDQCTSWPKRESDPTVARAATFGGPVLLMNGFLDAATPVEWAEKAAATLPVHQLVVTPTGGHGLMDDCAGTIKGGFFSDPSVPVASSCATSRSIKFYYPGSTVLQGHGFSSIPVPVAQVLMPPAKTHGAKIANRILAASRPSFGATAYGIESALRRRTIALHRR